MTNKQKNHPTPAERIERARQRIERDTALVSVGNIDFAAVQERYDDASRQLDHATRDRAKATARIVAAQELIDKARRETGELVQPIVVTGVPIPTLRAVVPLPFTLPDAFEPPDET